MAADYDASWRLYSKAREAADVGKIDRADALYRKARKAAPGSAYIAFAHAELLAGSGRVDDALDALGVAVEAGYRNVAGLERSEPLATLHDSPRWETMLDFARANAADFDLELDAARRALDPGTAEAFPDVDTLLTAREAADRAFYEYRGEEDQGLRRARFTETWAAALTRAADDASDATERERALIELVRLRVESAGAFNMNWREEAIEKTVSAADRYLAALPSGENALEARLAQVVAATVAPEPDDWLAPQSTWPQPRCTESLPALEDLANAGKGTWSLTAGGFRAICLQQVAPTREDEIRKYARAYLAEEELRSDYDFMLRGELKVALWRIDGLPEFEAEGLDGNPVTLADFEGKVTLLDFWDPG